MDDADEVELDEPCECGSIKGRWQSNGGCGNPECCGAGMYDLVCAQCGDWCGKWA